MAYTAPSITQSGWNLSQLAAGGVTGLLEQLISTNTGPTSAPTAAPTLAAASGGTLPNATYYVTCTETNGLGETTNGGQVSAGQAANAQKITVTFQTLKSGNTARNVYIGTSAGGPFMLVARGITAATYDITALPTDSRTAATPPATNLAGITTTNKIKYSRAAERGNLQDAYRLLQQIVSSFNSGAPVDLQEIHRKLKDVHVPIALLNQLCVEVGTLIDSNPGTIVPSTNPIGNTKFVRKQP